MLSKLTMIGMHEYSDGSMWSNLNLPEGIDRDMFINECLRQGGEFPLVYPDLDFFKMQIGEFSKKWYKNFERWYKAYQFEYEALYNLDVKSTVTEEGTNKEKNSESSNGSMSHNDTENHSDNTGAGGTNTTSKAAFDSSDLQVTEQNSTSGNTNSSGSSTSGGIQTSNESKSGTSDSEHKIVTTEVRQGNQGITMSQEMLLAEYNAWSYNLYNHMAEIFISEFCICIYV